MTQKLRDLIRSVRACKTAAEERAIIAKECALIRTAFKANDNTYRHRNVAKLLYIHMLGFPTHWGQMECLKLIAAPSFPEKRIGYLGLMVLLDEKQKVLMLVTNSLKNDFQHPNSYIAGLALCSMGNICTADMARDLANEVEKFFKHGNPYLRKKAALCAVRCVRKVPELAEEFVHGAQMLISDPRENHAVLLTGINLVCELIHTDPKLVTTFRKSVPTLVRILKQLLLGGYVNEYDVVGITDPFLQTAIIRLFKLLGMGSAETSEQMNDILAQVAINTEPTKNPGNAILYECVQTIMSIEAENGLRVLAINILGRFLQNRDNNIRYVALNTLCKCVESDTQAIQRHRNTVVECLKDADISIRRRALDLIYALVTKNNVRALIKELLNYLALTSGDNEFKADLTEKICMVAERFAPSKRWHIDTVVAVLATAGNHTRDNVVTDLVTLIARSKTLHAYAVHKLYTELKRSGLLQLALIHVALWAIGEYGELLVTQEGQAAATLEKEEIDFEPASEGSVLELISSVLKSPESRPVTREYALNALAKLTAKFSQPASAGELRRLLGLYQTSMNVELQQRSCEYTHLFADNYAKLRPGVLARMPMPPKRKKADAALETKAAKAKGEEDEDSGPEHDDVHEKEDSEDEEERAAKSTVPAGGAAKTSPAAAPVSIIPGFEAIFGGAEPAASTAAAAPPTAAAPAASSSFDILSDIFGGGSASTAPAAAPAAATAASSFDPLALFGGPSPAPAAPIATSPSPAPVSLFDAPAPALLPDTAPAPAAAAAPPTVVFDSKGVSVAFSYEVSPSSPSTCVVRASFSNSTDRDLTGFDFQVAVPKYVKLTLEPATSSTLPARSSGSVTQVVKLENTMLGKKKIMIKARVVYTADGAQTVDDATINQFPI